MTMGRGELSMVSLLAVSMLPVRESRYLMISRLRLLVLLRKYRYRMTTTASSMMASGTLK